MNPPASSHRTPFITPAWREPVVVFAIGLVISLVAWRLAAAYVERNELERFTFEINEATHTLVERIDAYQIALLGGVGLFSSSAEVTRHDWQTYVEALRTERYFPGMQGMGYAERVPPSELSEHVTRIRAEGFPDYALRPAGPRDDYTAIIYLEPFDIRNQQAFGFDMFSEPVRQAAMARARDTNETILSGRVVLVQEIDEDVQAGFLMYAPVYQSGRPTDTVAERRAALQGYVYSPFRASQLVRGIFPSGLEDLRLQIFDGRETTPASLLHADSGPDDARADARPGLTADRVLALHGSEWTLRFETFPSFFNPAEHYLPAATLLIALLLSLLFSQLIRAQRTLRGKTLDLEGEVIARREAEAETRHLNEQLEQRVQDRTAKLNETARALRENEERMRLATAAAEVGVWEWEITSGALQWDDRMFAVYGLPPTADGRGSYEDWKARVLPEDFAEQDARLKRTVATRGRDQREFRIVRASDQAVRVIHAAEVVIAAGDGRPERVIGINLDITERKEAEDKIRALNQDLERKVEERTRDFERARVAALSLLQDTERQKHRLEEVLTAQREIGSRLEAANAELAQASHHKDEFLANMSHELRTPLNAILGLSEALLEQLTGPLNPRQMKSVATISTSGQHLLTLINDILDLSQIEAGALELQMELLNLRTFCESCLSLVRTQAQKKNLHVALELDPRLEQFSADGRRFKQVLVNLLTNAVKFTPDGRRLGLSVTLTAGEDAVRFTVWDAGEGIAASDQAKLFRAFTQLDSGLNRAQEGTGLGLSLVSKLVDLHGGSVTLESAPGQGSRFIVTLPQRDIAAPQPAPVEQPDRRSYRRALIIEDDVNASDQLKRYLAELGITTATHTLGEESVEVALRERPDVILLDLLLPDESGWVVLDRLRNHPGTREIPVVVVSVMDEPKQARAITAAAFFTKPVSREQLAEFFQRSAAPANSLDSTPAPPRPLGPLVILAEDNPTNIQTIGDYLEAKGYNMRYAHNGREAVQLVHEIHPALVIMDIQMPVMDGLEAIQEIRTDPTLANLPIIALTALAMPGDRERCLAAGANAYLSKPVTLKSLVAQIDHLLPS